MLGGAIGGSLGLLTLLLILLGLYLGLGPGHLFGQPAPPGVGPNTTILVTDV